MASLKGSLILFRNAADHFERLVSLVAVLILFVRVDQGTSALDHIIHVYYNQFKYLVYFTLLIMIFCNLTANNLYLLKTELNLNIDVDRTRLCCQNKNCSKYATSSFINRGETSREKLFVKEALCGY